MVMADRPEVETASAPVTALAMVGLAESMLNGLARVRQLRILKGVRSKDGNFLVLQNVFTHGTPG